MAKYLKDIILSETNKKYVNRIMSEFRDWEILESNNLTPTKRILFCGHSGCGKTVTAEAIASELALPLLYVRFDSVVGSLLGEKMSNIGEVFNRAKENQCVILFDDDSIIHSSNRLTMNDIIKTIVNSFFQVIGSFNRRSLVIFATNFEQALDSKIWKRFDEVVRFELPEKKQIEVLIKKFLYPLIYNDINIDIQNILERLEGSSFAEVEKVCLDIRKTYVIRGLHIISNEFIDDALGKHDYRKKVLKHIERR